jgi:hypothetical protein
MTNEIGVLMFGIAFAKRISVAGFVVVFGWGAAAASEACGDLLPPAVAV